MTIFNIAKSNAFNQIKINTNQAKYLIEEKGTGLIERNDFIGITKTEIKHEGEYYEVHQPNRGACVLQFGSSIKE